MAAEFSYTDFGREIRIERSGNEVSLVFIATSKPNADSLVAKLLGQLKVGVLNMTMAGTPTGERT